ncbi:MAG: DUF4342 domain-containing protein [Sarcina sp.]
MDKITLEKVDTVIERTFVTYKEAKLALEETDGNVLDAIILIEESKKEDEFNKNTKIEMNKIQKEESIEEIKSWLMNLIKKGNVSRIKIKKEEEVLIDLPMNAGIAGTVIGITLPPILIGIVATVAIAKLSVEIIKIDGSVEVVDKCIREKATFIKDKSKFAANFATVYIKGKTKSVVSRYTDKDNDGSIIEKVKNIKTKSSHIDDNQTFSYTVNFEEMN